MDEEKLFAAWHKHDAQIEHDVNEQLEQKIKMMDKKSNDIFNKIKKKTITEIVFSIIFLIGAPILLYENSTYYWGILALLLVAAYLSYKMYFKYIKGIDKVNELDIVKSLEKKVSLFRQYVNRQRLYVYILSPIGFFAGFALSLRDEPLTTEKLLFVTAFAIPFLIGFLWLAKKYVERHYGKHLKELESLLNDFKEIA